MVVSREKLYEEVWAEPMVKVAARYNVSSSFLARICGRLRIPTPGRGYWAQVAASKGDERPPLPEPQPGDELEWSRGFRQPRTAPAATPRPPDANSTPEHAARRWPGGHHGLLLGAREEFEKAPVRDSLFRNEYPRPLKKILVDIVVSKEGLGRALRTANAIFISLEARGYSVKLGTETLRHWRRPDVDPREDQRRSNLTPRTWSPIRPTLCFVGTVAVGLTLYELSEEAPTEYINGKRVRISDAVAKKKRLLHPNGWQSTADFPTGRFVLRAYSPYSDTTWSKEWRESKPGELTSRLDEIAADLLVSAPAIVAQFKEAEQRADIRRKEWEERDRKWKAEEAEKQRREAEQRRAQARKDSFNQLVRIIEDWSFARQMESFFNTAIEDAAHLGEEERMSVLKRLHEAREMFGGIDPLPHFRQWKAPEER